MALRSFEELIEAYPTLGPEGCREEARNCEIDPAIVPRLAEVVAGYDTPLLDAMKFWTNNNDDMVRFMSELLEVGDEAARANLLKRRVAAIQNDTITQGLSSSDVQASALHRVAMVDQHARRILAALTAPLFAEEAISIYRGTAVYLDELDSTWWPGRTVTNHLPVACTLNANVVPMHFAWKRRNKLHERDPGRPIASIMIEIKLVCGNEMPLLWAGHFKEAIPGKDFRWQQEVIAPPGVTLSVESCEPIPDSGENLYRVRALGSLRKAAS